MIVIVYPRKKTWKALASSSLIVSQGNKKCHFLQLISKISAMRKWVMRKRVRHHRNNHPNFSLMIFSLSGKILDTEHVPC
jgi:hypothetical protein